MKRKFGLDLIRAFAIFFVISVHFFLNINFYHTKITNIGFLPMIFLRTLFFTCVPLFLLLTGYLKRNKKISKDYYIGIKKIIISYLFISIICIFFNKIYLHTPGGKAQAIISIFNFTADKYSWYIEMYIGLFLLIPFLNILYSNLKTKENKKHLIATLLILVSLSSVINYIKYKNIYLELIPNWWNQIYPILYYFIGCYIGEYQIKINKKKGSILLLLILAITSLTLFIYNYNQSFSWNFLGEYSGLTTVITSTLIFLLIYDIDIKNKNIKKTITSISIFSLDMYLFSYITDKLIYTNITLPKSIKEYYYLYPIIVLISFTSSYLLSYLKQKLFGLLSKNKKINKILN